MAKLTFRKKLYRGAVILILMMALIFAGSANALAYTTEGYQIDVTVGEDNSFRFTESITVDFDGLQHGILRHIPEEGSSGLTALKIDEIDVDGWDFDQYTENNTQVLRIGDPEHYLTGRQIFTFAYRLRVYDDKDTQGDMLYVDLLPANWETPVERAEICLKMPKAIEGRNIELYASGYGSANALENFSWKYDEETMEIHIEGENIPSGVGITVYCPLPEGYWIGQLDSDWAEIAAILLVFLVPFIIFLLRLFSRRSRGEQACGVLGVMLLFGTVTGTFALASLYTHDENLFYGILIILIILFFAQFVLVMRESKRYAMQKGPALVTLALGLMLGTAGCVSGGIVLFAASGSLWLGLGFPAMIFSSMLVNARMFKRTPSADSLTD